MTVVPRELGRVARPWNDAVIALTADREDGVAEHVGLCANHPLYNIR